MIKCLLMAGRLWGMKDRRLVDVNWLISFKVLDMRSDSCTFGKGRNFVKMLLGF